MLNSFKLKINHEYLSLNGHLRIFHDSCQIFCIIYFSIVVPTVRPYDVKVLYLGDTFANISWKWDSAWLDYVEKTNNIRGEMKGFKVNI